MGRRRPRRSRRVLALPVACEIVLGLPRKDAARLRARLRRSAIFKAVQVSELYPLGGAWALALRPAAPSRPPP